MQKRKYLWTKSFGVHAQVVGEFLDALPQRTAEQFVEASRNKKSPTHSLFEWDDRIASTEYRLVQARVIINSLDVVITPVEGKPIRLTAYIRSSDRGAYTATPEASNDELNAEEERCLLEMRAFKARWRSLKLAREVIATMQQVEASASRRSRKKK